MTLLDVANPRVNPDWVTPGWVPLVLVLIVGIVCVGLFFNMRKHVRIARENDPTKPDGSGDAPTTPAD